MTAKKSDRKYVNNRLAGLLACLAVVVFSIIAVQIAIPSILAVSYNEGAAVLQNNAPAQDDAAGAPLAAHLQRPASLRAIYMSQCVVGTPSFRDELVQFIDDSELNAVVIDVRDFSGKISFQTDNPVLKDSVSDDCGANDMREFVQKLHEKNIFVIARITTFQNPHYTKLHPDQAVQDKRGGVWKDHKGLAFVDVGAKPYWDAVVELGKESYALGFDELNFDYVRFPSDGPMAYADYSWGGGKSKPVILEEFFKYLTEKLRPTGAVLSADLFGMAATNEDDLNIGQVLERALPYFDYIYPMVYPSHYPSGYNGFKNVNEHSYDIVKLAMETAVRREAATTTKIASLAFSPIASTSPQLYEKPVYRGKVVPWLQSFDYPVTYTAAMVSAQIRATKEAGVDSYLFWDAANKYRALRQVLAD